MAQTGVQILFAFLLTPAFYSSFHRDEPFPDVLTSAPRLVAPMAAHRMTFRLGGKAHLVWVTHRFAGAGLELLSVPMMLAIRMVIALLFCDGVARATVSSLALLVVAAWVVLPQALRSKIT